MSLAVNFLFVNAGMAGGVKSSRLIAEALARRGHDVRLCYPRFRRPRPVGWARRLVGQRPRLVPIGANHLEASPLPQHIAPADELGPDDVPDADFSIVSWWALRERLADWPARTGQPVHYLRHHEVHAGPADRVEAVHRLPGPKAAIARWLVHLMADRYDQPDVPYIPNGIDRGQFTSPPRRPGARRTVGFLYSAAEWKCTPVVIEAVSKLRERGHDLGLVCFGSHQPDRGPRLPRDTVFHHLPAQSAIAGIYRSADCWVVASRFEGLGMPGLEAAACGCPLVSTASGGPEDYTRPGENGELVPPDDPAAMADAIERIALAPEPRWCAMSEASRAVAREFDWDRSAERLEQLLEASR